MPLVTLHKVGEGNLYHLHVLDSHATDPGYGRPGYGGGHPDHDLPGRPNRPDQGLPGGGHPDHTLPGAPGDTLPVEPPPTLAPGYTLVMIRGPGGHWAYAAIAPGSPPPRPLPAPTPPNRPDNTLPDGPPPRPDQGLPPTAGPKPAE